MQPFRAILASTLLGMAAMYPGWFSELLTQVLTDCRYVEMENKMRTLQLGERACIEVVFSLNPKGEKEHSTLWVTPNPELYLANGS